MTSATPKPRAGEHVRWADQYDFDRSDPATRLFIAASNWVDRCEAAEAERDSLAAQLKTCKAAHMSNCLDADKLRAQNRELREALRALVAWDEGGPGSWDIAGPHKRPFDKARAVLAKHGR